jgi:hypothetical protein
LRSRLLKAALDQYLAAVVKHDPRPHRCRSIARDTERRRDATGQCVCVKTVTGLGKVQRKYVDPVSGQAAYFGIVDEGANSRS